MQDHRQSRRHRDRRNRSRFLRLLGEVIVAAFAFRLGSFWVRLNLGSCNDHHKSSFEVGLHPVATWGIPVQPKASCKNFPLKELAHDEARRQKPSEATSSRFQCQKTFTMFMNMLDNAMCLAIIPEIAPKNSTNPDFLLSLTQSQNPKQRRQNYLPVPWYDDHSKRPPWRWASAPKPILLQSTWWPLLADYASVFDGALEALRKLLRPAKRKSYIILVASAHHLELLENFDCAARQIQMDRSQILVIALDTQVLHISQKDLGLLTFYDQTLVESLSGKSTTEYASQTYGAIMLVAKVHIVHLVSELGEYDFLFQDVDVLPLRREYYDRLDHIAESKKADIVFQYDYFYEGKTPPEYAPWFVNSGLFLVKRNAKTRHFFTSLVQNGDLVLRSKSHQALVSWLLSQHVSRYGLRVHVMDGKKEADEFPGGYHFHNRWDYMRDMLVSKHVKPYVFHMNYNDKKATKKIFFEQMGLWFVQNHSCVEKVLPVCHFWDKPSVLDCRDSPTVESGEPFWGQT